MSKTLVLIISLLLKSYVTYEINAIWKSSIVVYEKCQQIVFS